MVSSIDFTLRDLPALGGKTERADRPAAARGNESGAPGFPTIELGTAPEASGQTDKVAPATGASFADVLGDALQQARALEAGANQSAVALSRGEAGIHETMIAQEKAAIAVRYAITMKNKALEAYREILQTQI